MSKFTVSANGQEFGVYEGNTEQDARDACAEDFASSESMWVEYIDPDNTTPFESVSYEERVRLAQAVIDGNE